MAREAHKRDRAGQVSNRKHKAKAQREEQIAKQGRTAASRDKAEETASNSLCTSLTALDLQLKARSNNKESRLVFLKEQIYARIAGEQPRLYPNLGREWRKAGGKIRMSPASKEQTLEDYLIKLFTAMVHEDSITCGINDALGSKASQDYIRALPSIACDYTNPKASAYKLEYSNVIAKLATPVDDPVYLDLHAKYSGAILFDYETRATHKLFRIAAIQFVRSFSSNRPSCWEATCEPGFRDSASGDFLVHAQHKVAGSEVLQATALQGYALTEYPNGMDQEGVHLPWVDNYVAHFKLLVQASLASKSDPAIEGPSTPLQPTRKRRTKRK
jgi:hypothetical protein